MASKTIGSFVTLQRGITYKGNLVGAEGPALLGLGSIVPGGGFRESDYKTYGGDCPEKITLKPGDIFASLKGATKDGKMIGSVARVPNSIAKGRLTQDTVKLEFLERNTSFENYIYWLLRTPQYRDYCAKRATGSAVVALSRDDFLSYPVPDHTDVRARIITLLESIEQKITLNRQINQTLEQMALTLFKSWFVDFDPVMDNALDAGNPIPEELQHRAEARKAVRESDAQIGEAPGKQQPLPDDVRQLFPDAFEESELGWVPKGWVYRDAESVASVSIGKTPPRKESQWFSETPSDNVTWVSIRDMGGYGAFTGRSSEYLTQDAVSQFNVKRVPKDSVLLSFKLTLGRVAIARSELTTNEAIAHFVNPKFGLNKEFLYSYLSTFDYDRLGSTSSIATAVNSKIIKRMPILVPTESASTAFEYQVGQLFEKMKLIDSEVTTLTELRDTLLPRLISGELRLDEVEAAVEQETVSA
ncbi:TPA: restriction endonuclease subunit S [Vibrio vulnificus]|uniref:restriction endonuclease subunit S n=1 Tax=Vibrio vulnificus TaxID=672 RepID=UPI0032EF3FE3